MAFQYKMQQRKHLFVSHHLRAVKCGVTSVPLPTAAITSWAGAQGWLCCLPTRQEKGFGTALDGCLCMNNTVLSVRLQSI